MENQPSGSYRAHKYQNERRNQRKKKLLPSSPRQRCCYSTQNFAMRQAPSTPHLQQHPLFFLEFTLIDLFFHFTNLIS